MTWRTQAVRVGALVVLSALACRVGAWDQGDLGPPPVLEETNPAAEFSDEAETNPADDLDALLNIAEEDVSQLARVSVSAPAMQEVVTTVARHESTVGRSPAAVFVVTNEMIRRSGAQSIPEVLRMVPGVHVARIDASKWAVSIRGFNGRFANKLLVQIDGRTVYTPLFAGVFWDVQQVLLEDVERIEVIRGPGATLWGANAVNGVINVITKSAKDTQGEFVQAGGGNERGFGNLRYGGTLGQDAYYRVYGQWFEVDEAHAPPDNAHDDWRMGRGGFRLDWEPCDCRHLTFQGDYYDGYTGRRNILPSPFPPTFTTALDDDAHVSGGNVLLRYTQQLSEESDWSLQTYFDRTERDFLASEFLEERDTFDIDFQHHFPLNAWNRITWGAGYRSTSDRIENAPFTISFSPTQRALDLYSAFIQDEMTLAEDQWYLIAGSKFQHNDFTGFEIQPSIRLLWTPDERHSLWSAVSRAVRTPSRAEDDITIRFLPTLIPPPDSAPPGTPPTPLFPLLSGNRSVDSEELIAYEFGMRGQPVDHFSWDLAVFLHDYDNLVATSSGPPNFAPPFPTMPLFITNSLEGQAYGFEMASTYQVNERWKLYGAYTFLRLALQAAPDAVPNSERAEGESPRNQFYVQSSWDLSPGVQFDLIGRYSDNLPALGVPSYFVADARLAWYARPGLELAVVGRHLLDSHHAEFGSDEYTGNLATEVEQEVFGVVTWRY